MTHIGPLVLAEPVSMLPPKLPSKSELELPGLNTSVVVHQGGIDLSLFIQHIRPFFFPSNTGKWSSKLAYFMYSFVYRISLQIGNSLSKKVYSEDAIAKRSTKMMEISDLEIKNFVTLEGYQDNVYKYLNNSLCYFSTSLWEGPDLAMLDAAFLNVPIICSDCQSGRKEFIDNNRRGYIFKTNDMNSLMQAFKIFFSEDTINIKKKLIESKKEVKNFTQFRYYSNLIKILNC